jgi:hypothetical protein
MLARIPFRAFALAGRQQLFGGNRRIFFAGDDS